MTSDNLAVLLRAREEELSAIYANLPGIVFYVAVEPSGEFRFLSLSHDFLVATGLNREQVVGSLVRDIIPPESREMVLNHYREAIQSGQTVRWEEESQYRAGRRHGEVAVTPLYDAGGIATHLIGIVHDITDRKVAEDALRSVSGELRNILQIAPAGLTYCNRDLRYVSANPAFSQYVGLPLEQIVGRSIVEVMGKEAFEIVRPRIERVLRGETVQYEDEVPIQSVRRWFRVAYAPHRHRSGEVIGWVASIVDITESKRVEEELAAEARRKDEFLSLLGHELRNPLAAISTAVQLLSTSVTDEQRDALKTMTDRQLKLMRRLLDDLLDLGRLKHGHIQLRKERIDLGKFLRHVTEVTQSAAAERGQEMILRLPSEVVTFQADEARLEQIAMNLLSNASKYTPQGGSIEFSGARQGSEVVLRCKDNGRGIPREMQQAIFEPFTRVGPLTGSRGEASLGIGLALTKRLVELHEGTISVESDLGRGTEFVVRLPLKPALSEKLFVPETIGPLPIQCSGSIVLVEDNADVAASMGIALKQAGYGVTLFPDASSALAGLSDAKPDAILLDIGLPDMDGYTLATKLRQKANLRPALFIALSGFKQREIVETDDDFDHYFTKPVNYGSLLNLLESPLPRARARSAPVAAADPAPTHHSPGVLLIDDHAELSAAMAQLLRQEGLEVRTALCGEEGLRVALDFRPGLILCDLNLPDIRGPEVVRRLRADPITAHAYLAILTALSAADIRSFNREAAQMGVDEFIRKPLTPDLIHSLIGKLNHTRSSARASSRRPN